MMKVVCKNNQKDVMDDEDDYELSVHQNIIEKYKGGGDHLTIDKIYEVFDTDVMDFNSPQEIYYSIENKSGQKFWYSSNRFKTVSENREEKLNELGL